MQVVRQYHHGIDPKRRLPLHRTHRFPQRVGMLGQQTRPPIPQSHGEEIGRAGNTGASVAHHASYYPGFRGVYPERSRRAPSRLLWLEVGRVGVITHRSIIPDAPSLHPGYAGWRRGVSTVFIERSPDAALAESGKSQPPDFTSFHPGYAGCPFRFARRTARRRRPRSPHRS